MTASVESTSVFRSWIQGGGDSDSGWEYFAVYIYFYNVGPLSTSFCFVLFSVGAGVVTPSGGALESVAYRSAAVFLSLGGER